MIVAYRWKSIAIFLYGFAKRDRENIESDELVSLRQFARRWLIADDRQITQGIREGEIQEVTDGQEA